MADEDDETPLLPSTNRTTTPSHVILDSGGRDNTALGTDADGFRGVSEADKVTVGSNERGCPACPPDRSEDPQAQCHLPPRDIISIFVVAFDSKEGNLLEWRLPQELSLEGVEFRALISGAHTVTSDFIFFRQGDYFGAACYEKLEIISDAERGARMKSVGVIVSSYSLLHHHLEFLAQQVSPVDITPRQMLVRPGEYTDLEEYYQERKAFIPSSWDTPQKAGQSPIHAPYPGNTAGGQDKELLDFLSTYGEQTMVLWRATLLRKRVLLLSAPPIGPACSRVRTISLLSSHTTPGLPSHFLRPLFYVSLADMDLIQEQHSYVACTTERIFEEKSGICDIYVDNQNVKVPSNLQHVLAVTPEDRKRFSSLQNITQNSSSRLEAFHNFFADLNNRIFATLSDVSLSTRATVGKEEILSMGLSPQQDQGFMRELAATHGFDLTVKNASCQCCGFPCCCCCVS